MKMGMNHWEWEGMGLEQTFPHTSSLACPEMWIAMTQYLVNYCCQQINQHFGNTSYV